VASSTVTGDGVDTQSAAPVNVYIPTSWSSAVEKSARGRNSLPRSAPDGPPG
jgi:hypothetical protein